MADTATSPAKGNALTRKIGPLPTWVWVSIVAVVILLWAWYKNRQSAAAATTSSTSSASTTPPDQQEEDQISALQNEQATLSGEEAQTEKTAQGAASNAEKQAAINRSQTTALRKLKRPAPKSGTKPAGGGAPPKKTPVDHHARTTRKPAAAGKK